MAVPDSVDNGVDPNAGNRADLVEGRLCTSQSDISTGNGAGGAVQGPLPRPAFPRQRRKTQCCSFGRGCFGLALMGPHGGRSLSTNAASACDNDPSRKDRALIGRDCSKAPNDADSVSKNTQHGSTRALLDSPPSPKRHSLQALEESLTRFSGGEEKIKMRMFISEYLDGQVESAGSGTGAHKGTLSCTDKDVSSHTDKSNSSAAHKATEGGESKCEKQTISRPSPDAKGKRIVTFADQQPDPPHQQPENGNQARPKTRFLFFGFFFIKNRDAKAKRSSAKIPVRSALPDYRLAVLKGEDVLVKPDSLFKPFAKWKRAVLILKMDGIYLYPADVGSELISLSNLIGSESDRCSETKKFLCDMYLKSSQRWQRFIPIKDALPKAEQSRFIKLNGVLIESQHPKQWADLIGETKASTAIENTIK